MAPGRRGTRGWAGPRAFLDLPPDALGPAHPGRGRPAEARRRLLARLLPANPRRRRLPERRRLRGLLPDTGSVPPPQRVAGRPRRVRRARRRLSAARHGGRGPDRPARHLRRRAGGAPGLDRGGRAGPAAPPLGLSGDVGHLRPGPLQLRAHDRGEPRDHGALPGGRPLRQPLGRIRHVLLRALPERLPRRHRPGPPAGRRTRATRRGATTGSGGRSGSSPCGGSGTPRSARSTPTPASFPTPAAAPPARST